MENLELNYRMHPRCLPSDILFQSQTACCRNVVELGYFRTAARVLVDLAFPPAGFTNSAPFDRPSGASHL